MIITQDVRPAPALSEIRRKAWGRLFGLGVQDLRVGAGMSIEEAAGLSGMQISEWMAIEEGYVPCKVDRLRAMAAALEVSYDKLLNLAAFCREAWEQ